MPPIVLHAVSPERTPRRSRSARVNCLFKPCRESLRVFPDELLQTQSRIQLANQNQAAIFPNQKRSPTPPEQTHAENFYWVKQMETQTPVTRGASKFRAPIPPGYTPPLVETDSSAAGIKELEEEEMFVCLSSSLRLQ